MQRGEQPTKHESAEREPIASREDYMRESPAIRTLLKPFTTPGYAQPNSADKMIHGSAKQPVSYSTLKRIGALEEKGLSVLFRVGGTKSTSQQNDRPLGGFPRMYSLKELEKPDVRSRVVEAQRLLQQYGPFLIEDGLLAP